MKEGGKWCSTVTAIVMALIFTGAFAGRGAAVTTEEQLKNWPASAAAYQGAELEKVREWEKTWAGTKISKDSIDQVKDFYPNNFMTCIRILPNGALMTFGLKSSPTRP